MKSNSGSSLKGREEKDVAGKTFSRGWITCRSSGLKKFFSQLLKSKKPNLLDIGAVSGSSIQFLASLGCKVYADNIFELGFTGHLPYDSQLLHGILVWEAADMLDPLTAEKFFNEVERTLKPGGMAFLVSAPRKKDQTEKALQFRIKDRSTFDYSYREDMLLKKYLHSNRDIMNMLHQLEILTFNLLKSGEREIVIKKVKRA